MVRGLSERTVQEQRGRALAAALELFNSQGIEAVSLRAIASEVELSAMALYRYFPGGKGEVLATLRGRGFDDLAAEFERAVDNVVNPVQQILALSASLVGFALRSPGLYRLMFEITQPEEYDSYLQTRRALAWRRPGEAFSAAIREGSLQGDAELLPHLVFAALHGVILFEISGQPNANRRVNRMVAPLLELLFRGAGATPGTLRKVRTLANPKIWARP